MQLTKLHTTLFVTLCAALAACSADDAFVDATQNGKTPIELSIGGVDAPSLTRAVITDGTSKTLNPFDANTKIFMVMKSEYGTADFDDPDNPHVAKYTVARGDVLVSENDNANNRSIVKFDVTNQRYWDDAHARSSQLDIWAYAQKGQSWTNCTFEVPNAGVTGIDAYKDKLYNTAISPTPLWSKGSAGEIYPAIRRWRASHYVDDTKSNYRCQDGTTVMCQDLLFSNNLTNNKSYNGNEFSDNRLKFNFETRKFPQVGEAHMIFYHAMSKITIHIKKGEGFTNSDPFTFTTGNVKLKGFNTEGLFNIKTGQFEYIHPESGYDIPEIYKWTAPAAGDAYTLEALVIPNVHGNVTGLTDTKSQWNDDNTTKSMEFIIDHNKYEVSQDQLYEALKAKPENSAIVADGKVNLEAGKNYVFTFTVGKQKINNITAQVAEWENVAAEEFDPSNARITLNLEERGSDLTNSDHFSLYRAADNIGGSDPINDAHEVYNWTTGYNTTGETPSYVAAASPKPAHWTTTWYWDSNKHFYHFRALAKDNGTTKETVSSITTDDNGDYFTLTSAVNYDDILWGAPMKDVDGGNEVSDAATLKWNYGPTTNGFDGLDNKAANVHQIYKAIGPTEDPVKLILFHMMSDISFNIKTTTGADKVNLGNGTGTNVTSIKLEKIHTSGKLLMGNGLVLGTTADVANSNYDFTAKPAPDGSGVVTWSNYGAIPQDLTNVVLVITTPDHNQYKVAMAEVLAAASNAISTNNIANPYSTVQSGTNAGKYIINRWYPGFKYTYTFTLAKTGITNLQATIVDWENVNADDETVTIK